MEKILVMLDGLNVNANTVRFACYLSRITNSKLTGILIENPQMHTEISVEKGESPGILVESVLIKKTREDDEKLWIDNVNIFQDIAEEEGVEAYIDADETLSTIDVVHETRFADILIVDAKAFYNVFDGEPNNFIKEVLAESECPVVISPEDFEPVENVVFCYNGMKSSVFAIKQFMYLFPELKNKRAKIINLAATDDVTKEDEQAITNWLNYHFKDVEFIRLEDDALNAFFNYLRKKRNDFVVMGAYGKGLLTSFFENDFDGENDIVRLPLFIAHY